MRLVYLLALWLCPGAHYGDHHGHGTETYKSEGRAKQEADCSAVDDLRSQCRQEDLEYEPGYIQHDDPVCSSATVNNETYWTCDVDVWSYCYKHKD